MSWISDSAVDRLRGLAQEPDFSSTRYSVVRELGRGGMGVVYEAEDRELERRIAVKVLAVERSTPAMVARLRNEARTIARLEHPGIVPVHDVGELPDGRAWYAMKLVRGLNLREHAQGEHNRTDLLRTFLRICEAVAFAHAHGVVHGDLKPENVMIGPFGDVLVMDWGVAERGLVVGTPGFMAPEQEQGEVIDARADVYALGRILRFLIDLSDQRVPRALAAIAAKAAAADREHRYDNAGELAADMVRFLDGEAVLAYRETIADRIVRLLSRHRALVVMLLAYLVMRVIVFFYLQR